METVDKTQTRTCPHREEVDCQWITNDGMGPPVLWITKTPGPCVVTLTNQTFRVNCLECFVAIRATALKIYSRDT